MLDHLWLVLAGPALGALVNGLWPPRWRGRAIHGVVACAAVGASFSVAVAQHLALSASGVESVRHAYFTWFRAGPITAEFALRLDPLASVMCLTVTGVAFLIHIYSLGYMADDRAYVRFFAYLNLFTAAMLLLVMASNLALLFVGWEGVGLCSYLLVGFWHERESASRAGFKAFALNRVGDAAFLLGIMWCFRTFRTLEIGEIRAILESGASVAESDVRWITLLLFIGATGKSAQIPLYVWLPDAMEGPTPVSALIHAATMVTAGVYMVVRMSMLYHLGSSSAMLVAWIGGLTAILAASIAVAQNDIKRVLAYSTISQLGYMFLAAGLGAYVAAIFHLVTHAFFKACLFLGAGSVIHATHGEQDILRMGGLRRKMRVTHATFLASTLAIAGIAPFSGFWSKEGILAAAYESHRSLYGIGLAGVLLTAFYMSRLLLLVFAGEPRMRRDVYAGVCESPPSMAAATVALASLAVVGGALGLPGSLNVMNGYLGPLVGGAHGGSHEGFALGLAGLATLVAMGGMAVAGVFFTRRGGQKAFEKALGPLYGALARKYSVDETLQALVVRPASGIARLLGDQVDLRIVDGAAHGIARTVNAVGAGETLTETGRARDYAVGVLLGTLALAAAFILSRL